MRLFVLSLLAGSLLLAACSARESHQQAVPTALAGENGDEPSAGLSRNPASGQPDNTPSPDVPTYDEGVPPTGLLVRQDGTQFEGGRGTYCWTSSESGICVDYVAHVSNVVPIPLAPGEIISIEYAGPSADTDRIRWYAVTDPPTDDGESRLLWRSQGALISEGSVTPSTPGRYLITVFSQWESHGDASYGFFVEIEAA